MNFHEYLKWVTVYQKHISTCDLEILLLYRSTSCAYICVLKEVFHL